MLLTLVLVGARGCCAGAHAVVYVFVHGRGRRVDCGGVDGDGHGVAVGDGAGLVCGHDPAGEHVDAVGQRL